MDNTISKTVNQFAGDSKKLKDNIYINIMNDIMQTRDICELININTIILSQQDNDKKIELKSAHGYIKSICVKINQIFQDLVDETNLESDFIIFMGYGMLLIKSYDMFNTLQCGCCKL